MDELTVTRETDALVAEAMGWTEVHFELSDNGHNIFNLLTGVPPEPKRQSRYMILLYTVDPSAVVPMMERMGELTGRKVALMLLGPGYWSVLSEDHAYLDLWNDRKMSGATANLACCAALLAVWERVKGGKG